MSINKINYEIRTGHELSTKQWVGVGIIVLVALTAIALGTMALLNLKANMTFFHALGGMKEVGAWVLIGTGAAALTGVLSYLGYKYILHSLTKQILLEKDFDLAVVNEKFNALAAERVGSLIPNGSKKGRYGVWQPGQIGDATQQMVLIFQIDPDKTRTLIRFMAPVIDEENLKERECPSRGPLDDYREKLTDKNYMFMPFFEHLIASKSVNGS